MPASIHSGSQQDNAVYSGSKAQTPSMEDASLLRTHTDFSLGVNAKSVQGEIGLRDLDAIQRLQRSHQAPKYNDIQKQIIATLEGRPIEPVIS